jgi:nucleoside-diphosphate-sugar epimerase
MSTAELHVIVGAGQIGTHLARLLAARSHRVAMVARGDGAPLDGVTRVRGSIADEAVARRVGDGATAIYNCANPPYDRWPTELPPIVEGVIAAAKVSGARLVQLDNLYAFGRMGGAPMAPAGPFAPCSRKGALRLRLQERLLDAHAKGECPVAIAKASDFVGPGVVNAHLGARFFERVFAGKAGECFGDPSLPHAFTYGPDVAAALATLGARPEAAGRVWHVSTGEAVPMRDWAAALGRELGVDAKVAPMPGWLVKALGVFVPMMRELGEMRYQWEEPYRVDDRAFRDAFGAAPTPFATQVRETAAWARATYDRRAKAA